MAETTQQEYEKSALKDVLIASIIGLVIVMVLVLIGYKIIMGL